MLDVESERGELQILAGMDICFGGGQANGGVGTFGAGQLFNPAASGKILILTAVHWASSSTDTPLWGLGNIAFPSGIGTEFFRDTRKGLTARPSGQVRRRATGVLATATGQTRLLANTDLRLENTNGVAVLAPGTGFEIGSTTANTSNFMTFYWRERVAEPSELNF